MHLKQLTCLIPCVARLGRTPWAPRRLMIGSCVSMHRWLLEDLTLQSILNAKFSWRSRAAAVSLAFTFGKDLIGWRLC